MARKGWMGAGPTPCPLTEVVGAYLLRCVLDAGHDGCCWAAELEEVAS